MMAAAVIITIMSIITTTNMMTAAVTTMSMSIITTTTMTAAAIMTMTTTTITGMAAAVDTATTNPRMWPPVPIPIS